ncbi:ABC transporter ATP-binding protein [Nocardioides carbamazepini]|uniref:ABC transporter ATP-binding protein n=1 Tax=Nocardioides carbamazepini TaxID=2854259 RepID=UPI00214A125B|nr:ABC transporter ATP-binding protein [Nocardioides carbamazepini]MCR1781274.1 ABC transporter ATP-binding protein [Nocardioides carbamazepini]
MSALEISGLSAGYGAADVVRDISISVPAGEVVVVLGANGAGKTTTMRAICGLIDRRGSVRVDGVEIGTKPADVVRAGVSLVPQGRGTLGTLTVLDNLRVGAALRGDRAGIADDIERWTTVFPVLAERVDQRAGTLSGGEQQMLAVARALMARPRVLLCDEPSLGLAPRIVQHLFATLRDINREDSTSMLIVEQNAELAMDLASSVNLLEVGRMVRTGTPASFREDTELRRAYLGY